MTYQTSGVCSKEINFDIQDGIITSVAFVGGCNGSLKAVSALVLGQKPEDVIPILQSITCGQRPTSCPAQLALALSEAIIK